jgi:integrase
MESGERYRVLSLTLEHAVRAGQLPRNPAGGASLPKAQPKEKRFLSHAEVQPLADAAGGYRVVIEMLAFTGLRFGELAALRIGHVGLLRRRIDVTASVTEVNRVTSKTHHRRSVPIPRSLVDELAAVMAGRDPGGLLFTSPGGGLLRVGTSGSGSSTRR